MSHKSVLVTGCSGRIGRAVCSELLSRRHTVRGFDIRSHPSLEDSVVGNLTDTSAVEAAMQGMEQVIHLAATPDEADFMNELLPNNIVGVYNILEAARKAGIKRTVLTSSVQMNWRHEGPFPITVDMPTTPATMYAATKAFAESAGKVYSSEHGLQVVVVRPGFCPREQAHVDMIAEWPDAQDFYFSAGDAGRFFSCIVDAEFKDPYCVVFGASRWVHRPHLDLEIPRKLFGYEPQNRWPEGVVLD
ncbi:MAG: NAD(P)-dependent oxidoreductase [Planctomycetota bacterium]|nr:NAD(P)-dependent oxidoreductase [Planctomycetota bacterium]MDA1140897.1 NAD(P)-dependent oxidoreductase [Planctomycetota bacterium]